MHSDLHYYGTYAMARAAGLLPEVAQTIATAAQFVDDNDDNAQAIAFEDGGRLNIIPTAHPLVHIDNTDLFENDQRTVWLPFHFLPGNYGESISERLVCRKNSEIAQEMVDSCLSLVEKPFGLQIVGIAAHVYADTFSHYGFSGVSSRWNMVNGNSISLKNDERDDASEKRFRSKYGSTMEGLRNWRQRLLDRLQSGAAESGTGALGHGAVLKYPDYPYLQWEFSYEHSEWRESKSERDNVATFLEACEELHKIFCQIGQKKSDTKADDGRDFDDIRAKLIDILRTRETNREKRALVWCEAAVKGDLFAKAEAIRPYRGNHWKNDIEVLKNEQISRLTVNMPVFRFFQAAAIYRTYVLRDLLPKHGLVLD
ncbi:MAG: hypothetical protein OXC26_00990 [Albidovulum sp.]|nr:hypothetical protein [Albidovulum sp.]